MMILCIKPVVMKQSKKTVFTKGKTYKAVVHQFGINARNDMDQGHQVFCCETGRDSWEWFREHFA